MCWPRRMGLRRSPRLRSGNHDAEAPRPVLNQHGGPGERAGPPGAVESEVGKSSVKVEQASVSRSSGSGDEQQQPQPAMALRSSNRIAGRPPTELAAKVDPEPKPEPQIKLEPAVEPTVEPVREAAQSSQFTVRSPSEVAASLDTLGLESRQASAQPAIFVPVPAPALAPVAITQQQPQTSGPFTFASPTVLPAAPVIVLGGPPPPPPQFAFGQPNFAFDYPALGNQFAPPAGASSSSSSSSRANRGAFTFSSQASYPDRLTQWVQDNDAPSGSSGAGLGAASTGIGATAVKAELSASNPLHQLPLFGGPAAQSQSQSQAQRHDSPGAFSTPTIQSTQTLLASSPIPRQPLSPFDASGNVPEAQQSAFLPPQFNPTTPPPTHRSGRPDTVSPPSTQNQSRSPSPPQHEHGRGRASRLPPSPLPSSPLAPGSTSTSYAPRSAATSEDDRQPLSSPSLGYRASRSALSSTPASTVRDSRSPEPRSLSSTPPTEHSSVAPFVPAHPLHFQQQQNVPIPQPPPPQMQPTQRIETVLLQGVGMNAPICLSCGCLTKGRTTGSGSKNEGRYYYKCYPCNRWCSWADEKGNYPWNPPCRCGLSSRRNERNDGGFFYKCRLAACWWSMTETPEQKRNHRRMRALYI